jgi:hypothetical protein
MIIVLEWIGILLGGALVISILTAVVVLLWLTVADEWDRR